MRASSPMRLGIAVLLIAIGSTAFAPPANAQGQYFSTEATLIDGVEGLDVNRSTAITASVWAIESVDDLMLVGGAFTHVRDRSSYARIPRPYLAAFDPTSGDYVPWWGTQPDGVVYDILDLGDGRAVLIGEFESVNGVAGTAGMAVIDVASGQVDTSFSLTVGASDGAVIRAGAVHNNWLYLAGAFTTANDGSGAIAAGGLARISLATGDLDKGWMPTLEGGGGWGIGVASTGRVFVGGYFETVNGVADTETLVALSPTDGSLIPDWNHGYPHAQCNLSWRVTCGAVNGLAVVDDKVFVAGAKHFWAALTTSDGTILKDIGITNDGQSVDVVNGLVMIGCHCSRSAGSDEWPDIEDRYIRVIDPVAVTEIESPTVNTEGSAGGWASAGAPDGCLWSGGAFSSTTVAGTSHPAWNLLRFCPPGGPGANPPLHQAVRVDSTAPTVPGQPVVLDQVGSSVDLSWPTSADASGQVAYLVYRNGELVGRTSSATYRDPLLDSNDAYEWRVAAMDMAGNTSEPSTRSKPVEIGARYNLAPSGVVSMSAPYSDATGAEMAIDGTTNGDLDAGTIARTTTVAGDGQPWWGIDIGSVRDIDYVQVYPRTDAGHTETNNRLRVTHDTSPIVGESRVELVSASHPAWVGPMVAESPRVEKAELIAAARYFRLLNNSAQLSLAEVRIMTVDPLPTPATPALDATDPAGPTWKRMTVRGENAMLGWGGASDNAGVAFYRIYDGTELVGTTTDRSFPVGAAGLSAAGFTIIAHDAAGNASADAPGGVDPDDDHEDDVVECTATRDGASVNISWVASNDPQRFVVSRSVNGSASFWRGSPDGSARTWTDSDRSGVITYTVESRNGALSGPAATCSTDDEGGGLAAPATCSWSVAGGNVNVEWSDVPGATSVVVERSVDGGNWWWRGRADAPSTNLADTDRAGTLDYRVKAKYPAGTSETTSCSPA